MNGRILAAPIALICIGANMSGGAPPASVDREKLTAGEALDRYFHGEDCRRDLRSSTAFEIEASLPKMKKHGIMRGLKLVTSAGRVVYTQLHFAGDDVIKTAVIARFLAADAKESPAARDLEVSERNYRFRYRGPAMYNARPALVFRMEPRRRRVGLLDGELWIDAKTAEPLREWGELVKSPSVLLSHICVVRDYAPDGERSRPLRIVVTLRAAFAGPAELTMWLDRPAGAF